MNSNNPFSPHNDVLNASPSSMDDAWKLVEELKSRGRNSVATKRFPEAGSLYSKAIEALTVFGEGDASNKQKVMAELAVLYSNRSLVRLQMNDTIAAFDDATAATCYDETYVKGHWRLGQAATALNQFQDAIDALNKALQLEPNNKALQAEIQKVQTQLQDKMAAEAVAEAESNPVPNTETAPYAIQVPTTASSTKQEVQEPKKQLSKPEMEDADLFSSSDHVRGYKLVNGKKTSFFHHEQTMHEKQLIGDIAPKRIEVSANQESHQISSATAGTSAWNKAGTWEEKDLTQLAMSTLSETLLNCTFTIPDGASAAGSTVRVTKVSKLLSVKEGGNMHASMASVRGKKRFIFEFTACIHWEILLDTDKAICKGSITFPDVDGTHEIGQGYDICDYLVDADTPSHARFLLERFVRDGGLRHVLEQAMDQWIQNMKDNN